MSPKRTATCACGELRVELDGSPYFVAMCSCTHCQRRTGSVFGVSAYFTGAQLLEISGESRTFVRSSDSGRSVEIGFCPTCGTSVYWTGSNAPVTEGIGLAVGCFADPNFPRPHIAAWCASKHGWVEVPADMPIEAEQPS